MAERPILIIGPLPPPFGGARVSFQLFFDYIAKFSKKPFKHFDLPARNYRHSTKPGSVNHFRTIIITLYAFFFLLFSRSVVIFGSRNFCFSYGLIFLLGSKCLGKTCSIRFFGGHPMNALLHYNYLIRFVVLTIFKLADKIIIQTKIGADEFPEYLQNKICIIPGYRPRIPQNPIRILQVKKNDQNSTLRFIYAGAITREKGIALLIDAFCKLESSSNKQNSYELHLFGSSSQEITEHLKNSGNVFYHGNIENLSLRKSLAQYDAFVFPTVYNNEGHPGVLIEALMAGLPIIATDLPVIREVLQHEFNALLVRSGDVKSLFETMYRLADNQDLRMRLSQAALASCKKFDANLILPKLASILNFQL